jgi:hypothetical protein
MTVPWLVVLPITGMGFGVVHVAKLSVLSVYISWPPDP